MKLGFLTACLKELPLEDLVPWASAQGFETLELAAWPGKRKSGHRAAHILAEKFTVEEAERIKDLFAAHDIGISSLAYYDNNLHPRPKKREKIQEHLYRVIDAAAMLNVRLVGTFVGARPGGAAKNIKRAGELFRNVVAYAEDRGVRIMIENCPMVGWVQPGLPGNYAYSPELWEALFNEVPSDNFGLNFDPSHLIWLGINYNRAVRDFSDKLFHVHAKDAELLKEGLYRYGIFSRQLNSGDAHGAGWWRYRMPGNGQIDWKFFLTTLRSVGYVGPISIEHEDPEYEGSEERIKEGLCVAREHLASCLAPAHV